MLSELPPWILVIEVCGILSFALSGILEARKRDMDVVGTYMVALVTAFGGGTVRDLCIGRRPLFWIQHDWYLLLILGLTVVVIVAGPRQTPSWARALNDVCDAVGTGLFSVTGVAIAWDGGAGIAATLLLGIFTAITGGVVRDVLCNEIPYVFRRTELCATCALLGGAIFLVLLHWGAPALVTVALSAAASSALRLLSVWKGIRLPL